MHENMVEEVIALLGKYKKADILFDDHAKMQSAIRGIDREEVVCNLLDPSRLFYAREQKARDSGERKFDCYFKLSKQWAHRYVISY